MNCVASIKLASITITIGEKHLQAIFDSGAECSIIKESVAVALPGQRRPVVNYLKGIGRFPALSSTKLTIACVVDTISVELEFYVILDYEMSTDILVGMNLINDTDLSVIITSNGTKLIHKTLTNHVSTNSYLFNNLYSCSYIDF